MRLQEELVTININNCGLLRLSKMIFLCLNRTFKLLQENLYVCETVKKRRLFTHFAYIMVLPMKPTEKETVYKFNFQWLVRH